MKDNKLFNAYFSEVNSFQTFKKRSKVFDKFLVKFAAVSLLLLFAKILAEWLIEAFVL